MSALANTVPRICSRCDSPLEDGDLRCPVCALPAPVAATPAEKPRAQVLRCTECGAAVAFDPEKQAPCCAFCRAVMTIEQPADPVEAATLRLPFTVERELAMASLRTWLGKRGYFAPATLRDEAVFESLTPLCWAGWLVNAKATVTWTADSDHDARRSAWAPHAGQVSIAFDRLVIPASRGLPHDDCAMLVPYYDLSSLGPLGETDDTIESFDAQRSAAREHVSRAITRVAKTRVEPHIPGKRYRNVHVSCLLERQTTDRVALPAWVLAYRYRGSPYRAVVHGQRAEIVFGSSPIDWIKVTRVTFVAATILAAIVALIFALRAG